MTCLPVPRSPTLLELTADLSLVPLLCGKQWDVQALWVNAAGASNATAGPRVTMPACPACVASGFRCLGGIFSGPCCDASAKCAFVGFNTKICALPPTNPTGPGAVVTDPNPTNQTAISVTLAPATSNGGLPFNSLYRVVLTQVIAPSRRRLQAPLTLTKTSVSSTITFVAGQNADGE